MSNNHDVHYDKANVLNRNFIRLAMAICSEFAFMSGYQKGQFDLTGDFLRNKGQIPTLISIIINN